MADTVRPAVNFDRARRRTGRWIRVKDAQWVPWWIYSFGGGQRERVSGGGGGAVIGAVSLLDGVSCSVDIGRPAIAIRRHWIRPKSLLAARPSSLFLYFFFFFFFFFCLFFFRADSIFSPPLPPPLHSTVSILLLSYRWLRVTSLSTFANRQTKSQRKREIKTFFFRYKSERRSRPLPFLRSDAAAAGRIPASLIGRFGRRHSVDSGMSSFPFQTPPPPKKKDGREKKNSLKPTYDFDVSVTVVVTVSASFLGLFWVSNGLI